MAKRTLRDRGRAEEKNRSHLTESLGGGDTRVSVSRSTMLREWELKECKNFHESAVQSKDEALQGR